MDILSILLKMVMEKRVVLTFKGENYKNPHMWFGEDNEVNRKKAVKLMNELAGG